MNQPELQSWKPPRRHGHINWNSQRLRLRMYEALEQGYTLLQIAQAWGVEYGTLHAGATRIGYALPPADRLTLAEAADQLNLTPGGVSALCERKGVPMGYWGRQRTLTPAQADEFQKRQQVVRERPAGYVTALEMAKAWRMPASMARRRLKGLPRLALIGGPRLEFLYPLRDASIRAPKIAPVTCPAGRVTAEELAALTGTTPRAVMEWVGKLGCPSIKGRRYRYYRLDEVGAWLLTCRTSNMRARGERLLALLQQQRAA